MAYDDLPLRPAGAPDPPSGSTERPSPTRWVIVVAAGAIGLAVLVLWWLSRAQPDPGVPAATTAMTEGTLQSERPQRQPLELPGLADSDGLMRELAATLSRHALLARLVAPRGVVRTAALAVIQVGDGKTPAQPLAPLRPDRRVEIAGGPSGPIDRGNYARWDSATQALLSIAAPDAAQVYVNVKPLFDEAYVELGHPDGDFDEAIVRAIRLLASTPDVSADPILLRRAGYFEHEDPVLRALKPVQKQLILLGDERRRQIMGWLTRFARNLDLRID
jgi:hypothetical protein